MISNNTLSRLHEASAPFVSAGLIPVEEFKQLLSIAKKSQEEQRPPEEPLCLISRDQAAKILGISARSLDRLIKQRALPCVRVGKRAVRLEQRKIELFVEEHSRMSTL